MPGGLERLTVLVSAILFSHVYQPPMKIFVVAGLVGFTHIVTLPPPPASGERSGSDTGIWRARHSLGLPCYA
eukprot:1375406-Amorphochlora_amoeboformis.AAC.1